MAARTARATVLGTLTTVVMGSATWWTLRSAFSSWPGRGPVEVDAALTFLTTCVAGLVAGWATVLLAAATTSLVTAARTAAQARGVPVPDQGGRGLTGRVAAGLLVAASLGVAPATAVEAPTSPTVTASTLPTALEGDAGPTWTAVPSGESDSAGSARSAGWAQGTGEVDGVEQPRAAAEPPSTDDFPVPGWTPTGTGSLPVGRASGEVSLVSTAAATPVEDEVVVRRGDTLWDIAARHLGPHATDQDVAEAWPRWYAANKDVIGSDPDLIHPGQRLAVPAHGGAR